MKMFKLGIALLMGLTVTIILPTGGAHAVDYGNWSLSCVSGKICFWGGNYGTDPSTSTSNADEDFRGDWLYNSGASAVRSLDKGGQTWSNNFTGTTKVRVYTAYNYASGQSACIGKGFSVGPYPINNANGSSSMRGGNAAGC